MLLSKEDIDTQTWQAVISKGFQVVCFFYTIMLVIVCLVVNNGTGYNVVQRVGSLNRTILDTELF